MANCLSCDEHVAEYLRRAGQVGRAEDFGIILLRSVYWRWLLHFV